MVVFPGRMSGTAPKEDDHNEKYSRKYELSEQEEPDKISVWSDSVLVAEAK